MITKYTPGDKVEYHTRIIEWDAKWVPATVTEVLHELDDQGVYTTIKIVLYNGRRRKLCEPETRLCLR